MLVNYKFDEKTADKLDSQSFYPDDSDSGRSVKLYRCLNKLRGQEHDIVTTQAFVVSDDIAEECLYTEAAFSSFVEAKSYYDFLCNKYKIPVTNREPTVKKSIDDLPIDGMELTVQVANILKYGCGINTVGELRSASKLEIAGRPGMGPKRLKELSAAALQYGIVI
ncbi:hypothetical protein C5E26_07780 [Pectobacterium parmentieri]|uniref:DNA-directed RNA polymerase subunit alpha C-terminal domain-containing protein n=1 Tax=Pectobacterium parmentieri TaxID=1905730 RepID=UPI000EAE67E8|nr:DNA-directed RNA polymerase subunit alpha C-terminal domain-containing protein [Pectobacterium parmentieri]AYH00846.1 hypothetical protein C5E26_07780 [Pectobacterium parmentieri]AYH27154.1 hypothetical protein C5E20_08420 [Pectobacterium parmentieri]